MELLRHELYKTFWRPAVLIGLLCAAALIAFSSLAQGMAIRHDYGDLNSLYTEKYLGREGPVSDALRKEAKTWLQTDGADYWNNFQLGRTTVAQNRQARFIPTC